MPTEIAARNDKPALLAIVLAVGAVIGVGVERIVEGWKRAERRERWRKRQKSWKRMKFTPKTDFVPPKLMKPVATADAQLRVVMEAEDRKSTRLNSSH